MTAPDGVRNYCKDCLCGNSLKSLVPRQSWHERAATTKQAHLLELLRAACPANRIHRRVIVRDYAKSIYKASSQISLLTALEDCIERYESLHKQAGLLQCDISPNNLMVNEDEENPSQRGFLIDLDLAIKEQREKSSGARGKTGTRAFMAIGVLLDDELHSYMHDLESFF